MRRFLKVLAILAGLLLLVGAAFAAGRQTAVLRLAAAPPNKPTAAEVTALVKQSRKLELRALKEYRAGNLKEAQEALEDALDALKRADATGLPGYGDVVASLRQAANLDRSALKLMPRPRESGNVTTWLNIAIIRKETALDALGAHAGIPLPPANPPPITPVTPPVETPPPAEPTEPPPAPPQVLDRFDELDEALESLKSADCPECAIDEIEDAREIKRALLEDLLGPFLIYGFVSAADAAYFLEEIDLYLNDAAWDAYYEDYPAYRYDIGRAIAWKEALERAIETGIPEPPSILQSFSWAHNLLLEKTNVCIDLETTPPQDSVTVELFGPNGYHAKSPAYQPLVDGKLRLISLITMPGKYTDKVTTYDAKRVETGSATMEFTVKPPPDDGPELDPPCEAPTK
jgi:tetratricopeptide (TPR) repeat protein